MTWQYESPVSGLDVAEILRLCEGRNTLHLLPSLGGFFNRVAEASSFLTLVGPEPTAYGADEPTAGAELLYSVERYGCPGNTTVLLGNMGELMRQLLAQRFEVVLIECAPPADAFARYLWCAAALANRVVTVGWPADPALVPWVDGSPVGAWLRYPLTDAWVHTHPDVADAKPEEVH